MRTRSDIGASARRTGSSLLWVPGAFLLLLLARPALAQVRLDALTEVRSIRFDGVESLPERRLRDALRTRDRGSAYGLRAALGKIPLVPDPAHHPFSPIVLQQDVVRLRGIYRSEGFFSAQIRYDVERDNAKNLLDITFQIEEGRPLVLADVDVTGPDSSATLAVPEDERESWERLERSLKKLRGKRLDVDEASKGRERLTKWWQDRGYPRAAVSSDFRADTTRFEGHLAYRVRTGTPARFGEVRIEGNQRISETTVRRLLPIEPGEPYSAAALEQARNNLEALDIVRVASVDASSSGPPDSSLSTAPRSDSLAAASAAAATDSVLPVRVRITEADPRLVSGDLGYVTDAGVSSEARWTHRNFTGGGRSLTVTGLAQTGWLALSDNPDERYRLAVSIKQPAVFKRNMSAVLSPFVEYRDDIQDRSTQYGVNTTLVYQFRQLRSVSLDYQIAWRDIAEYRFGDLASGDIDLLTFLTQVSQGALDSLDSSIRSSTFTLAGQLGSLDDLANPRRGTIFRPAIQVSAPTSWSSTAFWRLDASANGFVPLGHGAVLATRVRAGRLFPFGKSIPGPDDNPDSKFLQLSDVTFTAGGTGDVRGWGDRLLGPKVPDVRFETQGDTVVTHVEGYVPLSGFSRASFSAELQVPFPVLGSNFGWHAFLDGGRVWTDDSRFGLEGDPHGQEHLFFSTGAGLDLRTPVGPIKVSAGYKLNPSVIDLVDAGELTQAAREGRPIETLHQENSRRWQFHLAIGASY